MEKRKNKRIIWLILREALIFIIIIGTIYTWYDFYNIRATKNILTSSQDKLLKTQSFEVALVVSLDESHKDINQSFTKGLKARLSDYKVLKNHIDIELKVYNDEGSPAKAKEIAEQLVKNDKVILVIGHGSNETSIAAESVYINYGMPNILSLADSSRLLKDSPVAFSLMPSDKIQGEFIAELINIAFEPVGKYKSYGKRVLIIKDKDKDKYQDKIQAFEGRLNKDYISSFEYELSSNKKGIDRFLPLKKIVNKENISCIYLLVSSYKETEELIIFLRELGYESLIIGPSIIGTPYFAKSLNKYRPGKKYSGKYSDNVVVPVPFLFDISGHRAHEQNMLYKATHKSNISWPYVYGYDAGTLLTSVIKNIKKNEEVWQIRKDILMEFNKYRFNENKIPGLLGDIFFDEIGDFEHAPQFGIFEGGELRSYNYQFVRSRFNTQHASFKEDNTYFRIRDVNYNRIDIVKTGMLVNEVKNIIYDEKIIDLDFTIWMKSRPNLKVEDIVFPNVVNKKIKIKKLDFLESKEEQYIKLQVSGEFYFNLSPVDFIENKAKVIIPFYNRVLNRYQLAYVHDSNIYMGIDGYVNALSSIGSSIYSRLNSINHSEYFSLDKLTVTEDVDFFPSFGDPRYLSAMIPFSVFALQLNISNVSFSLPRFFEKHLEIETELSITFLSFLLFVLSFSILVKKVINIHKVKLLRYINIAGALFGIQFIFLTEKANFFNLTAYDLINIEKIIQASWIIYLAFVINAIFLWLWEKLEDNTLMPIPRAVKTIVTSCIFFISFLIICIWVYDVSFSKYAVMSGAMTLVLGFAMREILMDLFTGIILSGGKVFSINTWIKIDRGEGKEPIEGFVTGINWRTINLVDELENAVIVPNSVVTSSAVTNYNIIGTKSNTDVLIRIDIPTDYSPIFICEIIKEGLLTNDYVNKYRDKEKDIEVIFSGINTNQFGARSGCYYIKVKIRFLRLRNRVTEHLWKALWLILKENNVEINKRGRIAPLDGDNNKE